MPLAPKGSVFFLLAVLHRLHPPAASHMPASLRQLPTSIVWHGRAHNLSASRNLHRTQASHTQAFSPCPGNLEASSLQASAKRLPLCTRCMPAHW